MGAIGKMCMFIYVGSKCGNPTEELRANILYFSKGTTKVIPEERVSTGKMERKEGFPNFILHQVLER